MSNKLHNIAHTVFMAVLAIITFLPIAAFSWLITVNLLDAAIKITGAWK